MTNRGKRNRSLASDTRSASISPDLVSPADRLALTLDLLDRDAWSSAELRLARELARTPLPGHDGGRR